MSDYQAYKRHGRLFHGSFLTILMLIPVALGAQTLSLEDAESRALAGDPSVEAVRSRQSALGELEIAAAQLPDPMIRMGVMSLPTDSFQLGQEPMTQVALGVTQKFPRGESRQLRAEQLQDRVRALDETARDRALQTTLAVREQFLEALKQQRLAEINRAAEAAFGDLEEITQSYYATGRVQQQDVLRAAVELAKVQERSSRIAEDEDRARARLAAWIGEAAWQPLEMSWPTLPGPLPREAGLEALKQHPRLRALHQQVIAADRGVALAEQNYKPEFALDLAYGGRGGTNADGSNRSDLLSVMVMMDVPLFRDKRQDRLVAASMAESAAAAFDRDDAHRRLASEYELHYKTLLRQRERLTLFDESLLEDARFNAESAFQAYQAALEDLTTLMRARITEFDLQLEYVRLRAESQKTQARLLYLQGAKS